MKYKNITKAKFISRPNRFIAVVELGGKEEKVHVKNTGRCRELLIPGCTVYLEKSDNPERKTLYDLIAVEKIRRNPGQAKEGVGHTAESEMILINMDSQAPNAVVEEWLKKGILFSEEAVIKREVTYGNSRFDFYVEDGDRKAFMEVKGVTLEDTGCAGFPDAPTQRGVKHMDELIKCMEDGFEAYIFFVIQMKGVNEFAPNDETHKDFGDTLRKAKKAGVRVLVYDCVVTEDELEIDAPVPFTF